MAGYGYEVTGEDLKACLGGTYARTHAYMSERAPLPDAQTVWPELSRELFGLIDAQLEPFDDAIKAVAELSARGVKIAVASSSVRERLDRTLARAGLRFEVTIAGDEIEHPKPAPDMFLLAARKLELPPGRCVVVEDSGPGVAAGRAAGMPTLGVCRVPGTEATLAQAHRVVHEVTADAILALLL
jgi:HAD superfamily hydrolase (TIGR01509 family)